jgi:dipeptidyl aminopeptidase/acylaminoacyl peptidase
MTSTRRYGLGIPLTLLTAALAACGGDSTAPPTTGTLEFNVVTTGVDIDADGFTLDVDGQPRVLPANGIVSFSALPGAHTLSIIGGFAFNCDLTSAPGSSANVVLATTTRVDVRADCTPYLRNTILYTSAEFGNAVMAMRPDGSRRVQLTPNQSFYAAPAVSPDGQSIAVAYGGPWDAIYALDRFGKGLTKLIGGGNFDGNPAWSPDGTKLAFRRLTHGPYGDVGRIFVVNRDGTGLRELTPDDSSRNPFDSDPSWSPDGTRLLFSRSGEMSFINADGTGLAPTGVIGDSPSWSRDGTHIAYQSINGGNEGIWVMDMSFTPHQLTTPVQADQMPRWSPDGSQLAFARVEGGVSQIYRMNADGSGITKLSTSMQSDTWPTWSPNF